MVHHSSHPVLSSDEMAKKKNAKKRAAAATASKPASGPSSPTKSSTLDTGTGSPSKLSTSRASSPAPAGATDSPTTSSPSSSSQSLPSSLPRPKSALSNVSTVNTGSVSPSPPSIYSPSPSPKKENSSSSLLDKGNVKVVVRVRPLLERESNMNCLISMNPQKQSTIIEQPAPQTNKPGSSAKSKDSKKEFLFDNCYWSVNPEDQHFANQAKVYNDIGKEFLDHNMEGYNTCIFAYGQTGSGKSYTMMGGPTAETDSGIIPRTCQDLFERIETMSTPNVSCTVRISYFEVYNEQVRDLLVKKETKLRVRESPTDGPYVEDLSEFAVQNVSQVLKYLKDGNKARATASTKMNDASSRSHAVFTLVVKQVAFDTDSDTTEERTSRIRLVDLAGSERANASGAQGARLREGSNINKSLTTLGRVIAALASHGDKSSSLSKKQQLVPYRDSILTWLLKESLGGNSKTAMVACISPTDYEETMSTLRYASQAKQIKTRAVINQDVVSAEERDRQVEEMQERINTLQDSLLHYSTQQQEGDQFKNELEKVRAAVRFYEERAIMEENKRKAVQSENVAYLRHNRLLKDHLKEVTNKNVGREQMSIKGGVDYDTLKNEREALVRDISMFKTNVRSSYDKYSSKLASYGIIV